MIVNDPNLAFALVPKTTALSIELLVHQLYCSIIVNAHEVEELNRQDIFV